MMYKTMVSLLLVGVVGIVLLFTRIPQCPSPRDLYSHGASQVDANCATDDGFDRERIVFVHLPKTGGTSFRYWLQNHFQKGDRSWQYKSLRAPKGWSRDEHNMARFASGHANQRSMLQGARVNATVVTILRNPTSRMVSFYKHHARKGTFDKYNFTSFYEFVAGYDQWKSLYTFNARLYYGDSLQEAQAFLENRVSLLGIYDRLPETLWLARELLPWLDGVPFPYENKGSSKYYTAEISPKTLRLLTSLFKEEYQLYAAAEKSFNQRLLCVASKIDSNRETS